MKVDPGGRIVAPVAAAEFGNIIGVGSHFLSFPGPAGPCREVTICFKISFHSPGSFQKVTQAWAINVNYFEYVSAWFWRTSFGQY